MSQYTFPAVLEADEDGAYFVKFPDVEGCIAEGKTLPDALESARDALCFLLYAMEKCGQTPPTPGSIVGVQNTENRFVTLILCDTAEYRKYYGRKSVKKTVTIPDWLSEMAEKADLNFSAVLTAALKEKLGVF